MRAALRGFHLRERYGLSDGSGTTESRRVPTVCDTWRLNPSSIQDSANIRWDWRREWPNPPNVEIEPRIGVDPRNRWVQRATMPA